MKTVLLAGNPNVGKSTLFNSLTGKRQHTGNWSGKTVAVASGILRPQNEIELVDLPGMYSLYGRSEDEQIAAVHLMSGAGDCVVVVCDGCSLERNLILALQIMQHRSKVILCINLMDEAQRNGISIDRIRLQDHLGIPVVFTAGARKEGLTILKEQLLKSLADTVSISQQIVDPVQKAKDLVKICVRKETPKNDSWRLVLDRLLVSSRRGGSILALFLILILWLTIWGANYPSALLSWAFNCIYRYLAMIISVFPSWLSGLLLDGVYSTVTQVISVMLPPLLIFFPLFSLLEDVGYLPRLAFLLERSMNRCGGCGKQALTICMGLGCNAVGVTGCRIISSPRQRITAILTNAMVPCNGRFPTLILLGTVFFGDAVGSLLVAGCAVLGVLGAMACTGVLNRSLLQQYPHDECYFMEIPPLRRPQIKNVLVNSLLDRTLHVAGRALVVAAPAGAVLWILEYSNVLLRICNFLDPLGRVLGMSGEVLVSFLLAFPANELFLPILLMSLGKGAGDPLLLMDISRQMAITMMIFVLFHWPCATTVLTIRKETASMKKTAAAVILPTAVGMLLCLMINLLC